MLDAGNGSCLDSWLITGRGVTSARRLNPARLRTLPIKGGRGRLPPTNPNPWTGFSSFGDRGGKTCAGRGGARPQGQQGLMWGCCRAGEGPARRRLPRQAHSGPSLRRPPSRPPRSRLPTPSTGHRFPHSPRRRTNGSGSPSTANDLERSPNAQALRRACREGGRSGGSPMPEHFPGRGCSPQRPQRPLRCCRLGGGAPGEGLGCVSKNSDKPWGFVRVAGLSMLILERAWTKRTSRSTGKRDRLYLLS